MKWALKRHCSERDYMLFLIGIYTELRVSDLLQLETQTIIELKQKKKRKEFKIKEGKTKKERMINLTSIFDEVYLYAQTIESIWLFPYRKGNKPINKIQTYRKLQKAEDFSGIEFIGTHTMGKTFGYWFYKQTKDVAILQEILNHSTPQIPLTSIDINKEEKNNILDIFHI